jgi:hypothetical protein
VSGLRRGSIIGHEDSRDFGNHYNYWYCSSRVIVAVFAGVVSFQIELGVVGVNMGEADHTGSIGTYFVSSAIGTRELAVFLHSSGRV